MLNNAVYGEVISSLFPRTARSNLEVSTLRAANTGSIWSRKVQDSSRECSCVQGKLVISGIFTQECISTLNVLVDPHLSNILPIPVPIVLRPPIRKSRVSGQSVLVPTHSFTLAVQVAQAVDVAVALRRVRTVHGFLAKYYCFASVVKPDSQTASQDRLIE